MNQFSAYFIIACGSEFFGTRNILGHSENRDRAAHLRRRQAGRIDTLAADRALWL
jgi:hypothetical protein